VQDPELYGHDDFLIHIFMEVIMLLYFLS
jgi:hypothetical protein